MLLLVDFPGAFCRPPLHWFVFLLRSAPARSCLFAPPPRDGCSTLQSTVHTPYIVGTVALESFPRTKAPAHFPCLLFLDEPSPFIWRPRRLGEQHPPTDACPVRPHTPQSRLGPTLAALSPPTNKGRCPVVQRVHCKMCLATRVPFTRQVARGPDEQAGGGSCGQAARPCSRWTCWRAFWRDRQALARATRDGVLATQHLTVIKLLETADSGMQIRLGSVA